MPRNISVFVAGAATAAAAILVMLVLQGSPDPSDLPAPAAAPAVVAEQPMSPSPDRDQPATAAANLESPVPSIATNEQRLVSIDPPAPNSGIEPPETAPIGLSLPIPVNSRELATHLQRLEAAGAASIHAQINGEAWDSSWARTTENQFASFYASQPELTGQYGIPVVHCRSTLCEIQIVARGATPENWLRLNGALFDQPWADQFGDGPIGYGFATSQQGETLVITQWVKRIESETRTQEPTSAVI